MEKIFDFLEEPLSTEKQTNKEEISQEVIALKKEIGSDFSQASLEQKEELEKLMYSIPMTNKDRFEFGILANPDTELNVSEEDQELISSELKKFYEYIG
ncbi:MAG: hypothetical protein MK033_05845 [Candidatus Caenarcaniphilales bacterium]|nr:hypothetical protein [Candidatus Caenarcaniphilales bacterium]